MRTLESKWHLQVYDFIEVWDLKLLKRTYRHNYTNFRSTTLAARAAVNVNRSI